MSGVLGLRKRRMVMALLVLTFSLVGCQPAARTNDRANTTASEFAAASEVENVLENAVYQLQPENLGLDSDLEAAVSLLETWRENSPISTDVDLKLGELAIPAALQDFLAKPEYLPLDGVYYRNCQLARKISETAAVGKQDRERINSLFGWVVRNVVLLQPGERRAAASPYEVLLSGRGNAGDRAWVFALALRQLRLDCVMLSTTETPDPARPGWVIGVPVEGEVYLFDPHLGLPVPSVPFQSPDWPGPAASMTAALNQPELLGSLALRSDQPYAVTSENLKTATCWTIVDANSWAPRLRPLEAAIKAEMRPVLTDHWLDREAQPGLRSRLQAALPNIASEAIRFWDYPAIQTVRAFSSEPDQQQLYAELMMPFQAPLYVKPGKEGDGAAETKQAVWERKQWRSRLAHLQGQFDEALQGYMTMRHLETRGAPDNKIQFVYQIAAEDSIYWLAEIKLQQGSPATALESLNSYLKRYRFGRWINSARWLLVDAQLQRGEVQAAIAAAGGSGPDDPYRHVKQLVSRHQMAMREAKQAPAAPAEQATPSPEPTPPATSASSAEVPPTDPASPSATESP